MLLLDLTTNLYKLCVFSFRKNKISKNYPKYLNDCYYQAILVKVIGINPLYCMKDSLMQSVLSVFLSQP